MKLLNETDELKNVKGAIHSIETCGTVDGPGIRYVVFTQGCPLRCQYCHNPDTWKTGHSSAQVATAGELMEDIIKYKPYMNFSGGGLTVSGGEPLMQADFTAALFKLCRKEKIHTCLDTSGFAPIIQSRKVFENTDLVLLDIKSGNPHTFKNITGQEISPTLETAKYLSQNRINMWIRFVLVPGLSDKESEIYELAEFISNLNSVQKVDVLPFHKMGEYKWKNLGYNYNLKNTPEPDAEQVDKVKAIFAEYGL